MPPYLVREGNFGIEGCVFIEMELNEEELRKMYGVVYEVIKDFNYIHYNLRIHNVDKAKFINYCLKRAGYKDAKYEYLG